MEKLAITEFAANNNESAFTKLSLFFTIKDLHLCMSFKLVELSNASSHERTFKQKALDISGIMKTTWEFAQKALTAVQESQSKQMDKHQKDITYTIRDKIWLSTRNITTDRPFKKLDHKILGFFKIIRNKRVVVELQLPQLMKIYNVFYPNLFQKTFKDLFTNQVNESLLFIIIKNKKE